MRFVLYKKDGAAALAALQGTKLFGARKGSTAPNDLQPLLAAGSETMRNAYESLLQGEELDPAGVEYLPPLQFPEKIICFGLNSCRNEFCSCSRNVSNAWSRADARGAR